MLSLILTLAMLLGSPLAHAVTCVMASTLDTEALAGMPADCPMFAAAMAEAAKQPQISVADCVKAPALAPADVAPPMVECLPGAVLPMDNVERISYPHSAPLQPHPPPDYGLAGFSHRDVLLETARLRP